MTLLEKAEKMGKEVFLLDGCCVACPYGCGLESKETSMKACDTESCQECWNREYIEPGAKTSQSEKADAGKLELDLVPVQIAKDIAQVRMYGNAKYGDPDNWKTVELRRYINALLRHMLAFLEDRGSKDDESGIEHYKHMACNMAFICEMMRADHE